MSAEALRTYLNDHLAGSVAAIELLDHLASIHKGSEQEQFFLSIRQELEENQTILRQLLRDVGGKESRARKATAWLTEKLGEVKLQLDGPEKGDLRRLEALETLSLGIQGQMALWRALQAAADGLPKVCRLDFADLHRRAQGQYDRVDRLRLQLAPSVLSLESPHGGPLPGGIR
jgi:hypothetical protein